MRKLWDWTLKEYNLLVWDEILFDYSKNINDQIFDNKDLSWYLKAINIDKAWAETEGDKNVVIAVIDNGFDLNHADLLGRYL